MGILRGGGRPIVVVRSFFILRNEGGVPEKLLVGDVSTRLPVLEAYNELPDKVL